MLKNREKGKGLAEAGTIHAGVFACINTVMKEDKLSVCKNAFWPAVIELQYQFSPHGGSRN